VVFHVAGDTNQWSKKKAQQTAIHVDGTRNMVEVAAQKGVKTFIHTSSVSVWGPPKKEIIHEDTPQSGETSWLNYEKTKWQAEQIALQASKQGMKVVCINPGSVVGPYDINTYATMFFALRDGEMPRIPPATLPMVHVNDVVTAHLNAVEKGRNGHRYIVVGEHISMKTFVGEIAHLLGKEKLPPTLPKIAMKFFGNFAAFVAHFTGKEPTLTPEIADVLTRKDFQFSNQKALNELGYKITPWQEGVRACYEWLMKEGLL
ncbi:MAG: NAD-dependent epimerase/dehydratase family protein, partial [Bacteroidota bacterium]